MMDFRMANISKQEAYDLLRDWIKLVARHTNPDQDISELLGWLWKLKPTTPDPITGLVPCGCGGKADCNDLGIVTKEGEQLWWVECTGCGTSTHGHYQEDEARAAWNRAMGGQP